MKRSTARVAVLFAAVLVAAPSGASEITFSNDPALWMGAGYQPTGVGWADIDGNGWPDLVVSNGGDQQLRPDRVYYNDEGVLSTEIGWQTGIAKPSSILQIGDLNNDGQPDLIVPSSGLYSSHCQPQSQVAYINDGDLDRIPFWESHVLNAWSCALGDPDGDGDIDIAFACGSPPTGDYQSTELFLNTGGMFGVNSDWQSDNGYLGVGIAIADIDCDGDHDLALGGRNLGVAVFYNHGGVLETTPSWQSATDSIIGGRQISFGDMNGDGYPELAVAGMGNTGIYGGTRTGEFSVFANIAGTLEPFPSWVNTYYYEPSCVAWGDADGDGDLDLAGGCWGQIVGIFENVDGRLSDRFVWSRWGDGQVQHVAWGDHDRDGATPDVLTVAGDGSRKLFHMGHKALLSVTEVAIDGAPLPLSDYCYSLADGWVSLATAPMTGTELTISFEYSTDLDLAVAQTAVNVFENRERVYVPTEDVKILLLMDDNKGTNYDINDATMNIREHFESYGWDITLAGLSDSLHPCMYSGTMYYGRPTVLTDTLITEISDVTEFDIVSIMPCTTYTNILASQETLDLVSEAVDAGLVVSGWCRGVRVLAAAGVLDGITVTGNADYADEYVAAGAAFIPLAPPIIQGNIVTGVRSSFYRTEICEAIKATLPPRISGTEQWPPNPGCLDSVLVSAFAMDYVPPINVELHVDTGNGFGVVPMYDDGAHGDGQADDSLYACTIPPVSKGTVVSYYLTATEHFPGNVTEDPGAASATSTYYSYTATSCCSGRVGDANLVGGDEPTIGDVGTMIDMLFLSGEEVPCLAEADVNQSGGPDPVRADITIGDISTLIDYLFITGPSLGLRDCL